MSSVQDVKDKVQRILTNRLGSVQIDRDGDFFVRHESAVTFVEVEEWVRDHVLVQLRTPLVCDVPVTPELTRWVAVEGQRFVFGTCYLNPNEDGTTGWVFMKHNLLGDDLDEDELMVALFGLTGSANDLDNMLQSRFGGELFGPED